MQGSNKSKKGAKTVETTYTNQDLRELEKQALKILEKSPNDKKQIRELLEQHATRYYKEYNSRT